MTDMNVKLSQLTRFTDMNFKRMLQVLAFFMAGLKLVYFNEEVSYNAKLKFT